MELNPGESSLEEDDKFDFADSLTSGCVSEQDIPAEINLQRQSSNDQHKTTHHINPTSWQPVLLRTLLDECNEVKKAADATAGYSYSTVSDRGWRLLEVLSQCQWKVDENYSDLGDLATGLIGPLKTALFAINFDPTSSDVEFADWSHLLDNSLDRKCWARDGGELQYPRRTRHRRRVRSLTNKTHLGSSRLAVRRRRQHEIEQTHRLVLHQDDLSSSSSSGDEDHLSPIVSGNKTSPRQASETKKEQSKTRRRKTVGVSPYVLHEDSDGFPLCWNEDAPIPSTNGGHLWLDDLILDLLHRDRPVKISDSRRRSATGIALMLMDIIRRSLDLLGPPNRRDAPPTASYLKALCGVVSDLVSWPAVKEDSLETHATRLKERGFGGGGVGDASSSPLLALRRSALLSRHWAQLLGAVLRRLARCAAVSRTGIPQLAHGTQALAAHLRCVCDLLTDGGRGSAGEEDEGDDDGGSLLLEYLLESAHATTVGLCRVVLAALNQAAPDYLLADCVQIASQLLSTCYMHGFSDSVRDLAIAFDLLAQLCIGTSRDSAVDGAVTTVQSRSRSNTGASMPSNSYYDRLEVLLSAVASVSRRLQLVKGLWLHCSLCRKATHERCDVENSLVAAHHHGILEFEIVPPPSTGDDVISGSSVYRRCCCSTLIKTIFECLRNLSGGDSKELALVALRNSGRCCCLPPEVFLSNLLMDLPERKGKGQRSVLLCLRMHLGLGRHDHPHQHSSVDASPSVTAAPSRSNSADRFFSCRFCSDHRVDEATSGSDDPNSVHSSLSALHAQQCMTGYVAVLTDFFQTTDAPLLYRLCKLIWRIYTGLPAASRELLCSQAVLPCLVDVVSRGGYQASKVDELKLVNILLALAANSLVGETSYEAVLQAVLPIADKLLYFPPTQSHLVELLKAASLLESKLFQAAEEAQDFYDAPRTLAVNGYIMEKFVMTMKLIQTGSDSLTYDSAGCYLTVVAHLLDLCKTLMTQESNGLEQLFHSQNGRQLCCQTSASCVSQLLVMQQRAGGGTDNYTQLREQREMQRLVSLLGQTVALALAGCGDAKAGEHVKAQLSSLLKSVLSGKTTSSSPNQSPRPMIDPGMVHRICVMLLDVSVGCLTPEQLAGVDSNSQTTGELADIRNCFRSESLSESEHEESPLANRNGLLVADRGYEGDSETSGTIISSEEQQQDRVYLIHPDLCIISLRFLLNAISSAQRQLAEADDGCDRGRSQFDFVAVSVLKRCRRMLLTGAASVHAGAHVHARAVNERHVRMLREQGIVPLLHELAQQTTARKSDVSVLHQVLLLLANFTCLEPRSEDFELFIKLLLNDANRQSQALVIETLLWLFNETAFEPQYSLIFPQPSLAAKENEKLTQSSPYAFFSSKRSRSTSPKKPFFPSSGTWAAPKRRVSGGGGSVAVGSGGSPESASPSGISLLNGLSQFFSSNTLGGRKDKAQTQSLGPSEKKISAAKKKGLALKKSSPLGQNLAAVLKLTELGLTLRQGVSVSLWLKLGRRNMVDMADAWYPVLSLGSEDLNWSVWCAAHSEMALLKTKIRGHTVQEKKLKRLSHREKWSHVVASMVIEAPEKLKLQLCVNGAQLLSRELGWSCEDIRPSNQALSVGVGCLGDGLRDTTPSFHYEIANMLAFKGVISHEGCLVLFGLGPRLTTIADSRARSLECCLEKTLRPNWLADIDTRQLLEDRDGVVEALQKSLLFTYCPSSADADTFHAYVMPVPSAPTSPTVAAVAHAGANTPTSYSQQSFTFPPPSAAQTQSLEQQSFADTAGSYLALARLKPLKVDWHCVPLGHNNYCLDDALDTLGGLQLLMFLFARMVDVSASESAQASALRLLMTAGERQSDWRRQFLLMNGYGIVAKVLSCNAAIVGPLMAQEIIGASIGDYGDVLRSFATETLVLVGGGVEENVRRARVTSSRSVGGRTNQSMASLFSGAIKAPIIKDPQLLCALLTRVDIWREGAMDTWERIVAAVSDCVVEANAHWRFNVMQLARVGFLNKFLQVCLETMQESRQCQPSSSVVARIVRLVSALVGHPPEAAAVTQLWDFIFLSHPASCTYLNYRIAGSSDWMVIDCLIEDQVNLVRAESSAARILRAYAAKLGKARVAKILSENNNSVLAVKRAYELATQGQYSKPVCSRAVTNALEGLLTGAPRNAGSRDDDDSSSSTSSSSADDASSRPRIVVDYVYPVLSANEDAADEERHRHHQPASVPVFESAAAPVADRSMPPIVPARNSCPKLPDLVLDTAGADSQQQPPGPDRSNSASTNVTNWSSSSLPDEGTTSDYHATQNSDSTGNSHPGLTAGKDQQRLLSTLSLAARATVENAWIVETRAGLLDLLSVVLLTGPDSLVKRLVAEVVSWEALVVMLNHQPNAAVRDSCVRALCALLLRCDDAQRLKFLKGYGFRLTANQLREFPCGLAIADSLFSLLCGQSLRLEDGLDAGHLFTLEVDRFQSAVLNPIFAVFENSLHDTVVFWNVASALQKVFENNATLAEAMLDAHLIETLVFVLVKIAKYGSSIEDGSGGDDWFDGCMVEGWYSLTNRVLHNCCAFSDLIHHQAITELFSLMFAADAQLTGYARWIVRRQLCKLLHSNLECIQALYSDEGALSVSAVASMDSLAAVNFESSDRYGHGGSGRSTPSPGHLSAGSAASSQRGSATNLAYEAALQVSSGGAASRLRGSLSNLKDRLLSGGSLTKRKNKAASIATHSELVERLKLCLQLCADLFLHCPLVSPISDEEEHLFEFYYYFLFSTAKQELSNDRANSSRGYYRRRSGERNVNSGKDKSWHRLLYSCRDKIRHLLAHLIVFVLFPASSKLNTIAHRHPPMPTRSGAVDVDGFYEQAEPPVEMTGGGLSLLRRQLLVARGLAHEVRYKQMLKSLLDINLDYQYALNLALHELLLGDRLDEDVLAPDELQNAYRDLGTLLKFMRHLKIESPLSSLDEARLRTLATDEQICLQTYQELRQAWLQKLRGNMARLLLRQQSESEPVSERAMAVTCGAVERQNVPRKLFIYHSKALFSDTIDAERRLEQLVADLCHPGGCCHDASSWPQSWALDPTEGPNRERRRLTPCHLDIPARFLLKEYRAGLEAFNRPPPLQHLLTDRQRNEKQQKQDTLRRRHQRGRQRTTVNTNWTQMNGEEAATEKQQLQQRHLDLSDLAGQLIDRLRIDEKIAVSVSATVLRSTFECDGEVLLGNQRIYFVGDSSRSTQKGLPDKRLISMSWEYGDVVEVYKRHHQLLDTALEIFFSKGETYLVVFETSEKRNFFLHQLLSMDLPSLTMYPDNLLQAATQWWREGSITNFEYLMHLNKLAGRTFSDLMQYPVFPFILSDYSSLNLDLNNQLNYRNLAKPIAIQDRKMEDHYVKVYKCLELEARRAPTISSTLLLPMFGPYHYGSHYSNSGTITHYLVRVPPFTSMAVEYQDNNFDIADRLFHSLDVTWRLSSYESTTDFKELIPEFFFFPDMFTNFDGLNLGVKQGGSVVDSVQLPPWCQDPRLFVLVHRQSLESAHVTANLHQWIDLVFGYKQTGQAAIDAVNVFHPATYHGRQPEEADIGDELDRNALRTMVRTYGQMPKQLFRAPHLPHFVGNKTTTATDLTALSPVPSVRGVRWGDIVGSPDAGEPVLVLKQRTQPGGGSGGSPPSSLSVVADGSCIGLPDKCQLLLRFTVFRKEMSPWSAKEVDSLGVVCWAFADSVVRARVLSPEPGGPWINLIALHGQLVTCCDYSCNTGQLFIGLKSGVVNVYRLDQRIMSIRSCWLEKSLYGLRGPVTAINVCAEFSLVVTGAADGRVILWDLNNLTFVRFLERQEGAITHLEVSKTTADVVTISQNAYGSRLSLETVNGVSVTHRDTDIAVCSLALSHCPEGTAVNLCAVGMQNGLIRLFNMWTLAPVREISHNSFLEPIVSIRFAHNCTKLYACTRSGTVLCWESANARQCRPPRFLFANPKM